ncbi:MAG TPA: isoleucine--tRNA ligase [Candidatus Kryptonia bacterium]|nr:isoleucine--tRNA ligase [Candidatus Kryptonia bacterium]
MDYKQTLNLPKTDFPMRANLPQREPEMLARWEHMGIYRRMQEANAGKTKFILHDGPPYANNNIHLGQALNKILKDFIVKLKAMSGHLAPYIPGWDCHGLPIELQVEKKLGKAKSSEDPSEIIRRCRAHALQFVEIQREEFKRLGVFGDWAHPYLTLDPQYEAAEVRELGRFMASGVLYRRKKPVYWCPSCVTALAEAEVEYADHTSPSVYVAFKVAEPLPAKLAPLHGRDLSVIIWTTTPWTLPANLAIAFHPELEYVAVEVGGKVYLVARGLLDATAQALGWSSPRELLSLRGADLVGGRARHPWIDRDSVFLLGEHVTLEQGTGCVHTAPGHGYEDYAVGLANGLDVYCPVDAHGRFTGEVPEFEGQFVFKADAAVLAKLREVGALLASEKFTHSYPHCWRCKQPVIFRATEQWFIPMEQNDLRQRALAEIDRVQWIPPWGRDRIRGMMESRPDWCISRQRVWGVPIVAVYCDACGEVIADPKVAEHAATKIAEHGAAIWFTGTNEELLPPGFRCPQCGKSDQLRREKDILDVWFDSGVSHAAVVETRPELGGRADLYLEGSDQHRGWFHTSLLTAVGTGRPAPYDAVLTHGFFVDAEGKKMSKSLGNVVAPNELTNKYGAEILRLWVSAADYRDDMRISTEILERLLEAYRRIRNTARFLLGNLYDFSPDRDRVAVADMPELDRWILHRTQELIARCREAYDHYEFHLVYHSLNNFCVVDLSALYLDIVKDRLYCSAPASRERRAAQTAQWIILDALTRLMAPILSFTADEIWLYAPTHPAKTDSVFLVDFPALDPAMRDDGLASRWDRLLEVRAAVTKALEDARKGGQIGHSLDARVQLAAADGLRPALVEIASDLPALFIVSQVELLDDLASAPSPLLTELKVQVAAARGGKCERCWNFSEEVEMHPDHPGLCDRCYAVVTALA